MLRQEAAQQVMELPKAEVARPYAGLTGTLRAYLSLTKPTIILLLLITTVPAMIIAHGGMPAPWLVLLTLAGGGLSAAGANTINCYLDRDIDSLMSRTKRRPLPAGSVRPEQALLFGVSLGAAAFATLALGVNLLSALLATATLAFYVVVYTAWLKRSSPQNIVIGGAAGAMPPVIGWAAVTGGLDWSAAALFAIIFLWTPAHFWALALGHKADYARAGVPMLPVVRGERETARQIFLYTVLTVAASLLLVPVAGLGLIYLAGALVLGAGFIGFAARLLRGVRLRVSRALFWYSLAYLTLLFAAIALDGLV